MSNTQIQSIIGNTSKLIGDVVVTWKAGVFKSAKHVKAKGEKAKEYLIENESIIDVVFVRQHDIIVFHCENSLHFRNEKFEKINGSEHWSDYYIDPFLHAFYRRDIQGYWYDMEGARVLSTFILKGDILTSLNGKTSIKNGIFRDQKLYTSPDMQLVQIGKVVLDEYLITVTYQGQRVTGLKNNSVKFEDGTVFQGIKLGVNETAIINEKTIEPIVINGDILINYQNTIELGKNIYHVFNSDTKEHYLNASNADPIMIEEKEFTLYPSSFIQLDDYEIVAIKTDESKYFFDLKNEKAFQLAEFGDQHITKLSRSNVPMENVELINVSTKKESIVIKSNDLSIYTGSDEGLDIEKIKNVPGFEGVFAMVTIKGKQQLFSLITERIIFIENLSIVGVDGHAKNKLLNAIASNGERVVIDLRRGFSDINIALSDGDNIIQTLSEPYEIGSKVLQNVKIQTLGGAKECVIDLNSSELSKFTFPHDMTVFSDVKSVFARTPLVSIDFSKVIKVQSRKFLKAKFRAYDDTLHTVILDHTNGRPVQMDGLGHRSELVTGFLDYSLKSVYKLGSHRMIGVSTLKEDLKPDQLLISIDAMTSWLPFSDGYLPIFKKVVEVDDVGAWDYHLFELRELSIDKEYIAVEQIKPNRILVQKKGKKNVPIVVKSKEKILKSPAEISMIRKLFFEDPGVLQEVY